MRRLKKALALACMTLASLGSASTALAQNFPSHQATIVVPYPPGGFNDTLARILSQHLTQAWSQSVVVENRPGGNNLIGNQYVARAKPDGYTYLITPLPFSALPALYGAKLPYDAVRDFEPVIWAGSTQNILTVRSDSTIRSVADLLAAAKKNPGKINFGSTGAGSSNHLSMELFMMMADVKLTHIPYKGSAPAVSALLAGDIDVLFDNVPNVLPNIQAGRLRAVAVTGTKRTTQLPEVPTVAEAGVPGYEVTVWFGVQAPAGTPKDIVARVNKDMAAVLRRPEVVKQVNEQGVEIVASTPEEFKQLVAREIPKWEKVVKAANVSLE